MSIEKLKSVADAKWQAFFRASAAAGVWFVAFALSLAIAKWSDGHIIIVALCVISFSFASVLGLLMIGTMLEAQTADRLLSAATKPEKTV